MRKGVIVSRGESRHKNIGDYVQTLAALQFAGRDADLLEREKLCDLEGESVRVVMNAWFMHHPQCFPPAPSVVPLFVSFHLTPRVYDSFFTERTVSYLKAHEPIGCRDRDTAEVLERHGIRAFFSSCLTLTLGETYHHREEARIPIFVDPWLPVPEEFSRARLLVRFASLLPRMLRHMRTLVHLFNRSAAFANYPFAARKWVRWLYTVEFHRIYSGRFTDDVLLSSEYLTHRVSVKHLQTERARLEYADSLLRRYENASFVVTSRLHCALPCTAMGTPVLVPYNPGMEKGRFGGNGGLLNLMPVDCKGFSMPFESEVVPAGRIGLDARLRARMDFQPISAELARQCRLFMGEGAGG